MAKVTGLDAALAEFNNRIRKAAGDKDVQVRVGYNAPYALVVHEDMEAHHDNGQAKFLEQPARQNGKIYGQLVSDALKQGKTMRQALMSAATALKLDSQALCPVDTGALKQSAFIRVDIGQAAKANRSIQKRKKTMHR